MQRLVTLLYASLCVVLTAVAVILLLALIDVPVPFLRSAEVEAGSEVRLILDQAWLRPPGLSEQVMSLLDAGPTTANGRGAEKRPDDSALAGRTRLRLQELCNESDWVGSPPSDSKGTYLAWLATAGRTAEAVASQLELLGVALGQIPTDLTPEQLAKRLHAILRDHSSVALPHLFGEIQRGKTVFRTDRHERPTGEGRMRVQEAPSGTDIIVADNSKMLFVTWSLEGGDQRRLPPNTLAEMRAFARQLAWSLAHGIAEDLQDVLVSLRSAAEQAALHAQIHDACQTATWLGSRWLARVIISNPTDQPLAVSSLADMEIEYRTDGGVVTETRVPVFAQNDPSWNTFTRAVDAKSEWDPALLALAEMAMDPAKRIAQSLVIPPHSVVPLELTTAREIGRLSESDALLRGFDRGAVESTVTIHGLNAAGRSFTAKSNKHPIPKDSPW